MSTINTRVKELMLELGLNTNDEILVIKISIIYLKAQSDETKAELEKLTIDTKQKV